MPSSCGRSQVWPALAPAMPVRCAQGSPFPDQKSFTMKRVAPDSSMSVQEPTQRARAP